MRWQAMTIFLIFSIFGLQKIRAWYITTSAVAPGSVARRRTLSQTMGNVADHDRRIIQKLDFQ